MIVRVTEIATGEYVDCELWRAMLLFGISPRDALALDLGLGLHDERHNYEALTKLN